jgi:hypothetical protein
VENDILEFDEEETEEKKSDITPPQKDDWVDYEK